MVHVSFNQKEQAKNNVGLTDGQKIECLMKYLNMTPSEFCIEFKLSSIAMNRIMMSEHRRLDDDVKDRIVSLYPDIGRYWLDTGEGYMNIGLYPNIKLAKSIEASFNTDINKFMSSKYIHGLSKVIDIPLGDLRNILDNYVQMNETGLLKVSRFLGIKVDDLLSHMELRNYRIPRETLPKIVLESIGYSANKHISPDLTFKDIKIKPIDNPSEFYKFLCKSLNKNLSISDVSYLTGMSINTVKNHLQGEGRLLSEYSVERYSYALKLSIKDLKKYTNV